MNCIFVCIFGQHKYVEMFLIMLESIYKYGSLDENTELLIYTSTEFMEIIRLSPLFNLVKMVFEINNSYTTIDSACKSRLDFFELPCASKYEKVLYLDTDIIINGSMCHIFDVATDDVIYVLEEGTIDSDFDYWGNPLFGDEINNYCDKSAFTTGIILFKNCCKNKALFSTTKQDIINRPYLFSCYDQPYIIYNAFKLNAYNNKLMGSYAVNNDYNTNSGKIIHHFPGNAGVYVHKIKKMTQFMNDLQLKSIQTSQPANPINPNILNIDDDIWTVSTKMRDDIAVFFKELPKYNIAEIGSYKGYTTHFLASQFAKVYAVDNNYAFTQINKEINKNINNIEYIDLDIYRNSWKKLPENIDVVFIDAAHDYQSVKNDIMNSLNRFKQLKYIIFDDYGVWPGVKQIVDELINNKVLVFETHIGITDVPGLNGIVYGTNEGILCKVNNSINTIIGKSYTWDANKSIIFLPDYNMSAFGVGKYVIVDSHGVIAKFSNTTFYISFNDTYTEYKSINLDRQTINYGKLTK